jgi:hypothetical protein
MAHWLLNSVLAGPDTASKARPLIGERLLEEAPPTRLQQCARKEPHVKANESAHGGLRLFLIGTEVGQL